MPRCLHTRIREALEEDADQFDPRHLEAVMRARKVQVEKLDRQALQEEVDFTRVAVTLIGRDKAEEMAKSLDL